MSSGLITGILSQYMQVVRLSKYWNDFANERYNQGVDEGKWQFSTLVLIMK